MHFTLWMAAVVFVSSISFARDLTSDEKISDLNQLTARIKSGYGPLVYKNDVMGINLDEVHDRYVKKVAETKTNGEFYYSLVQFVAEFRDSHFGAQVPTSQSARLNFTTDLVDGKVLIDTIDRKLLPETIFPFSRGDEIVEFGGQPTAAVVDALAKNVGMGFDQSARRIAAMSLSIRAGTRFPVPTGAIKLKIRKGTSSIVDEVSLTWSVSGEANDEVNTPAITIQNYKATEHFRNYDDISLFDTWTDLFGKNGERSFRCSGNTRIEIPSDATVIMMSPFVAYYHPTVKGNIGYLRIPHYSPQNEISGEAEFELRFRQYEYAVSVLEKNTVGLIIDQDHNCGGSVDYLERVVGLFMGEPYRPMQFQLRASKSEYLDFSKWLTELDSNTLEYQNLLKVRDLIKTAWIKGDFMTTQVGISGADVIYPNAIRYTKPIVMLIDELSGSGGDAFPAMMKGYGRATLVGTRTMGAGGHVTEEPALFYSQVSLRMTKSLFFRPDNVPVENNGAVPDANYTITRDDFVYGYRNYQSFYLKELFKKLP